MLCGYCPARQSSSPHNQASLLPTLLVVTRCVILNTASNTLDNVFPASHVTCACGFAGSQQVLGLLSGSQHAHVCDLHSPARHRPVPLGLDVYPPSAAALCFERAAAAAGFSVGHAEIRHRAEAAVPGHLLVRHQKAADGSTAGPGVVRQDGDVDGGTGTMRSNPIPLFRLCLATLGWAPPKARKLQRVARLGLVRQTV